jgi:hypothetical protein
MPGSTYRVDQTNAPSSRAIHGTSRLYKEPNFSEEQRSARESQRESQRASQHAHARMKFAGVVSPMGVKPQCVKKFPGEGESSLRTFGSSLWAPTADASAPRHATTNMLSYGVVAVPDWSQQIGHAQQELDAHPRAGALWIGTRYINTDAMRARERKALAAAAARSQQPVDPRLARWRANKAYFPTGARAISAHRAAAERKELQDLHDLGIGQSSARARGEQTVAPSAISPATKSLETSPQRTATAGSAPTMSGLIDAALSDDLAWVTGIASPWARVSRLTQGNGKRPTSAPLQRSKMLAQSPVPSLAIELIHPNSKRSVASRMAAPIRASG